MREQPKAARADVTLVLEGTFPYVRGGVSTWIDQIMRAHPEHRFAIVFLGSRRTDYGAPHYALPDNVVHYEEYFLYDHFAAPEQPAARTGAAAGEALVRRLIDVFASDPGGEAPMQATGDLVRAMMPGGDFPLEDFLYGEKSWDLLCEAYRNYCADPSFVDFFWSVRIMCQPLWLLARVAQQLIPTRVVHCASTGYAGFLGAALAQTRGVPLILSEHGIYTKERKIDLFKSQWIRDNRNVFQRDPTELSYFRQMWIHFFEWIGRYCYAHANPIIALYEANRQRQIADGAAPERTRCIPNGIDIGRFTALRQGRDGTPPPVLCLIGRVVPIKDVKTFVRAMRSVVNHLPEAQGWIAGPDDEDPDYAAECRALVRNLGLEQQVRFLGMQRVEDLMPQIGLVVLSSVSEALPLVLLEGYAAGVPAVATDVGSCRQLIEGLDADDVALGHSGAIVPIAQPQRLAAAAVDLLTDAAAWRAASTAAVARVERYYSDALMFDRYRQVYADALARTPEGI